MIGVKFNMKKGFFDRGAVIKALDRGQREALSKAGAFIRRDAKSSMKSGRGRGRSKKRVYSKPGEPPRVWVGHLKKFLYFAYDFSSKSVVIGPQGFGSSRTPSVLEYGGTMVYRKRIRGTKGRSAKGKTVAASMHLEPRPYMRPALAKNLHTIPGHWRNVVRS